MYLGHSLLALALTGALASRLGVRRSKALLAGLAAAAFALVPDVDSVYTLYVVLEAGPSNVFPTTQYVWTGEAWRVHRALTHSLLVGVVGVATAGLVAAASARRHGRADPSWLAVAGGLVVLVGGLVATGVTQEGALGAATMSLYAAGLVVIATLAARRGLPAHLVAAAAAVGLLTHPFGDVFMGRPPAFLYPLRTAPPVEKLALAADPTVNLVGLFLLELALAGWALWVVARLDGRRLLRRVDPRATLAVGFAVTALVIRPPTLDVAYHFALGALSTGLVLGVVPPLARDRDRDRATAFAAAASGLAAAAVAAVAYLVAYLSLAA